MTAVSVNRHPPTRWYTSAVETTPTNGNGNVELTEEQIEIVGRFNDYSFENPNLTFEEVVLKELGPDFFPPTPQGKLFEKECREVFDHERRP
jgi:hypothetical protein